MRYLIINKFGDINMSYKYCVCPFEGGNYNIVEINYIGNNMKPNIEIDRGRWNVIPYDDDCMIECKCNKCKQWKLIKRFDMYSLNSVCEKDFNILFNYVYLFLGGFIAAYLTFFNSVIFTW